MKKQIISSIAIVLLATSIIFSCKKKDETTPEDSNTTTTTGGTTGVSSSFQWQENGGSVITADSAFWTTYGTAPNGGTGVRAYKGGMANNFFEINWLTANNTSVGTKTLDPTYGVTFIKTGVNYTGISGQALSITTSSSATLSGNFSAPVTGGTITSITGTFTSINKK